MADPAPPARAAVIARFLAASPAAGWQGSPMAGDASARRFLRLGGPAGETAILMDADPATGEDLAPFLRIARHLRTAGLAAPAVLAADTGAGLALVEDLGPNHVTAWLARHPQDEAAIYGAAVDVLVRLQGVPVPEGLARLTPEHGAAMLAPFFDHFRPGHDADWRARVERAMRGVLAARAPQARTLSLRDFHAENLIWRPWRAGDDRIGLIDFQDAMETPAEYDLASLLRDARRDVAPDLRARMTERFAQAGGRAYAEVEAAVAVLAVQRNLRILGIFSRLAATGKPRYLALVPRVLAMLREDLRHPALAPLVPLLLPVLGAAP
ncbi:MAG: phosphotransferase [Rubellimicrobium sp.]|nr:phosphotransferase [Rubellimicrobium sp.]